MYYKDKLHSASPHAIIFLLIRNSCNYFPNCTQIHVITSNNDTFYYRRSAFDCEYLLIANYEYFLRSQLIDSQT